MTQDKIKAIREAVMEAHGGFREDGSTLTRRVYELVAENDAVRLADVLLTLNQKWLKTANDHVIDIHGNGVKTFKWYKANDTQIRQFLLLWNLLSDSLTSQSPECIDFLYSLIINKE